MAKRRTVWQLADIRAVRNLRPACKGRVIQIDNHRFSCNDGRNPGNTQNFRMIVFKNENPKVKARDRRTSLASVKRYQRALYSLRAIPP